MSLIAASQLTAVATAVLAAFAIVTAWYARRAFREQSKEVLLIQKQLKGPAGVQRGAGQSAQASSRRSS
jgi:hypothetical protein